MQGYFRVHLHTPHSERAEAVSPILECFTVIIPAFRAYYRLIAEDQNGLNIAQLLEFLFVLWILFGEFLLLPFRPVTKFPSWIKTQTSIVNSNSE